MDGEVISVFIDIAFNTAQIIAYTRPLGEIERHTRKLRDSLDEPAATR
jgi:hypothetical protein